MESDKSWKMMSMIGVENYACLLCLYQVRNMTVLLHSFFMCFVIWICHVIRDFPIWFSSEFSIFVILLFITYIYSKNIDIGILVQTTHEMLKLLNDTMHCLFYNIIFGKRLTFSFKSLKFRSKIRSQFGVYEFVAYAPIMGFHFRWFKTAKKKQKKC